MNGPLNKWKWFVAMALAAGLLAILAGHRADASALWVHVE